MRELMPFLLMLPALEAQEAQKQGMVIAYGSGRMKRGQADQLRRTWKRLGEAPRQRRRRRTAAERTPEQEAAALARLGINAVVLPPKRLQEETSS